MALLTLLHETALGFSWSGALHLLVATVILVIIWLVIDWLLKTLTAPNIFNKVLVAIVVLVWIIYLANFFGVW